MRFGASCRQMNAPSSSTSRLHKFLFYLCALSALLFNVFSGLVFRTTESSG